MSTPQEERGYRAAEVKYQKAKCKRKVNDGLEKAKSELIDILSAMEKAGTMRQFVKLNTIISKLEGLQNEIK